MFGLGCVDNCVLTYQTVLFGSEFKSKIVPFGTRFFIENLTVFLVLSILSVYPPETIGSYRAYYIFYLALSILSTLNILRISKGFKN